MIIPCIIDHISVGGLQTAGAVTVCNKVDSHVAVYRYVRSYALINRVRGPYEEIFVLTFKAYGPNAVRSMRLECQNKYFPYRPKSRLIRALLYTYPNKTV